MQMVQVKFAAILHCLTSHAHPPFMCFGGCFSIKSSVVVLLAMVISNNFLSAVYSLFCVVILHVVTCGVDGRLGMVPSCV